jgi:outer membrane protein assembly factor BamB
LTWTPTTPWWRTERSKKFRVARRLAVGVAILLAVFGIWRLIHHDHRGDLYAFDARDGKMVWHVRFHGDGPEIGIDGDTVEVQAAPDECGGAPLVVSKFDIRTGRARKEASNATTLYRPTSVAGLILAPGVVGVQGRAWRAHVPDRERPVGLRYRGFVFAAVNGKWPKCSE